MNEHLKFSWGHIIAFLAIIAVSYTTFTGVTYLTGGNFKTAGVVTALTDVVLLFFFIGAQSLKATDHKFGVRICVERALIFLSPLIFIAAMVPHSHFWTVFGRNKEIVDSFTNAIKSSKQMFTDYEVYSDVRKTDYESTLTDIINSGHGGSDGFIKGKEQVHKRNMMRTLDLQLRSSNYDNLKDLALKWINDADEGASTLNVFLIGNVRQIKESIHGWNDQLVEFSGKKMSNEEEAGLSVQTFAGSNESLDKVDTELDNLNKNFSSMGAPSILAIVTAVILYLMLLFPYCLQDRHTKSLMRLFPWNVKRRQEKFPSTDGANRSTTQQNEWEVFTLN